MEVASADLVLGFTNQVAAKMAFNANTAICVLKARSKLAEKIKLLPCNRKSAWKGQSQSVYLSQMLWIHLWCHLPADQFCMAQAHASRAVGFGKRRDARMVLIVIIVIHALRALSALANLLAGAHRQGL
jgi:hypothetical protein